MIGEGGEAFEVVRHPRARRTRLTVDPVTGRARLTLPRRASLPRALEWAREHHAWIERQRAAIPAPRPFVPGAKVPFDGTELTIACRPDAARGARREGDVLVVGGPAAGLERRVLAWLRAEALRLLEDDTAFYAARAGVEVTGVAIGDPKKRWGSCAAHGAIRYSWRLVMAPADVRRATAAHEVAHRVHMHHGPAFHALVAQLFGREPTVERAWLRAHGASLHWLGRSAP